MTREKTAFHLFFLRRLMVYKNRYLGHLLPIILLTACFHCTTALSNAHAHDKTARAFLETISKKSVEKIQSITLTYEVNLKREWRVRMKMPARLELRKSGGRYVSTFRLAEPVGADLWGRFVLLVYGRHTEEYRKMKRDIETTVVECFRLFKNNFITESLKEILPERLRTKHKKGFRILFDHDSRRVYFWKNRAVNDPPFSINYAHQAGPLTGFFNYLFFKETETVFRGINIHHREASGTRHQNDYETRMGPLSSHLLEIKKNTDPAHDEYAFALSLGRESFFDVIHGRDVYFNLTKLPGSPHKIPDDIFVNGIINKEKKRKRASRMAELKERKSGIKKDEFDKRRRSIESMNILSARDVRIRLRAADVIFE